MQNPVRRERTIAASPLSPAELARLGLLDKIAPGPESFNPLGWWGLAFRIVTSQGYVESGNTIRGCLRLERKPEVRKGEFRLSVEQQVLQSDGLVHAQSAEIRCAANAVATPIEWTLKSRFFDPRGGEISELTLEEDGRLPEYDSGPETQPKRAGSPPPLVTSDWCLFEAVQRLPFDPKASRRFDVLEGLSLARRGQRINYIGNDFVAEHLAPAHHFQQTGGGMLPYDYWLDERRRLILAVTFSRAYIVDENAVSAFEDLVSKGRAGLQRGGNA